jgi:hypothetical protein
MADLTIPVKVKKPPIVEDKVQVNLEKINLTLEDFKLQLIAFGVALSGFATQFNEVMRKQEQGQKSLDLIFADRTILEEIAGSVQHLKEIHIQGREHQDTMAKAVQESVGKVQTKVEEAITQTSVETIGVVQDLKKDIADKVDTAVEQVRK